MTVTSGRAYGGVSAADRSAARTRRLLDAGFELFGTRGIAPVTVGDICAEAGLTKRYFYERFSSIDEFVDAVMDELVSNMAVRVLGDDVPGTGRNLSRTHLAAFVNAIVEDPRVARLLLVETFGAGGSLGRRREELIHRAVEVMIVDINRSGRRGVAADPDALRMTAYALSGACAELLLAWLEGHIVTTADEVTAYLADLFSRAAVLTRHRSR